MDLGLKGKRAIITGGTRGIGRAIAETLAAEGCDIAICARNADQVTETVSALKAAGVNAYGAALDVRDGPAYRNWIDTAAGALGGLDIFIPNVSAAGGGGEGEENWYATFEVDVMGCVRGAEAALPHIGAAGGGAVVIIGSIAAIEMFYQPQAYNAMKAALITYGSQLAQAVASEGIRVNTVSPGPIEFPGGSWDMVKKAMPDAYEEARSKQPGGRMGTPEDVAGCVAFLASPRAAHVTGANLIVDGGFTKRVQF